MFPLYLFESPAARYLKDYLPGEKGLPLLGHSLGFLYRPIDMALELEAKHGPAFWVSIFGMTAVMLVGPEANQTVLRNQDAAFSNHQGWDFFIGKFFKRGIMLLDFEEHRFHRGIMQAAFKKPVMMQYLQRMNPAIGHGIERWKPANKFYVHPHIKQLTLDIATDVFMGERLGKDANRINKAFVDCVLAGTALIRYSVPGGRWRRGLEARRVLEDFFRSRIADRRANPSDDLFSRLCLAEDEQGQRFSDEDVVNHMIFLMMAAHDTTTVTLSAMFYFLAKNPEWQEKVRQQSLALDKPYLDYDDLSSLDQLGLVMKESLRMISPVHGIPRRTVKEVEVAGLKIPAGTFVMVSPFVTHHMAKWWPKPEHFDPERFADDRQEHKKHAYQYVPFGGGAHMCIGLHFAEMQVKTIMHQVLMKYRWSVSADYEMPINFTTLPSPKDKLPVRLTRL